MKSNVIEQEWGSYSVEILHEVKTDSVQYIESRRAFYAGAVAMFSLIGNIASYDDEAGAKMLFSYQAELRAFTEAVRSGKA